MARYDITHDRVRRVIALSSVGVHPDILLAAVMRSTDGENLGGLLGIIEDILDLGCTISDPK